MERFENADLHWIIKRDWRRNKCGGGPEGGSSATSRMPPAVQKQRSRRAKLFFTKEEELENEEEEDRHELFGLTHILIELRTTRHNACYLCVNRLQQQICKGVRNKIL